MSEIELPAPAAVWRGDHTFHLNPDGMRLEQWRDHALYTTEQVRAAILAERERCARVCEAHAAPLYPSDPEALGLLECAAAIRRGSV